MNLIAQFAMAAAESEHHGNVALETLIFGVIAAIVFALLGLVTFSYRHVANRHSAKAEAWAAQHGKDGHGAGHGH
jgi:heme/copper-type cytochrome/quinol oxidase subunit 2